MVCSLRVPGYGLKARTLLQTACLNWRGAVYQREAEQNLAGWLEVSEVCDLRQMSRALAHPA